MLRPTFVLGGAVLMLAAGTAPAQEKVNVTVAKYADLGSVVLKNRGKVVLVDFWHTT